MFDSREKIAVFIDGPSLLSASRGLGFEIDYRLFFEAFRKRGYLLRVYYYAMVVEDDAQSLVGLGLLAMTIVIQFTVPDGWPIHLTWAAMALGVITWGAGRLSLDHWLMAPPAAPN